MTQGETLGWIGVGKMGLPMASRALEGAKAALVHDVVRDACAPLLDRGARLAADPADIAEAADIVFVSLPNDQVLRDVMLGSGGLAARLRPGQVLVETSTVSPSVSAEVAVALAETGAAYVRAPISGSTALAEAGKLTVLASGDRAGFSRAKPIMERFATRFFFLGPREEARTLKLVINMLVGATSSMLAEALVFGEKGDLDIGQMLEVLNESAVASPLIAYKREMLQRRDFSPAFTVHQMIKDFDLILDTARDVSAPVFLTALIRQQYEAAAAQGLGEKDFFALLEPHEAQAGLLQAQPARVARSAE
ncbi:NAD(P)-dependent oxidoreductase [Rhizosaccharibacter radicis]|uniref:NAD(P)-dependent oxidoreductase n=1 Tax=Rhizosaccharibacter radicis TaxID=2782605 RepID=A0ABT1W2I4_9PROT|nr:NAD(P)-dependent oxidoreductase [Acetobacteraceae bacterium KSS12]